MRLQRSQLNPVFGRYERRADVWWGKRRRPDSAETVRDLRAKALSVSPDLLGLAPGGALASVWAVLMEMGYPEAVASLVAVGDGAASLYFSNGGGIIGSGEHGSVRPAVFGVLTAAEAHVALLSRTVETPLPAVGRVRFYVRTFDETLTGEAGENDLGEQRHPLWRLFMAGQQLITAMREVATQET
jgi:hypothetical protein